ncbi:patatin-like phospholipase family protein [Lachnoclostridium sp. An138]|uniref:patatin-like phospholipase family protein n=1 Tax=Lachnoclostridium sp. An138 TaxID=1965560 RepID=UPI000B394BAD|nr:patatin-like phospholipase family protein [Lachnoclostridium sp. An138]OUQ19309.1 patatin [Lachnoclostridium sp. An138]
MEPRLDLTKEYGLVLEGGGAKGAYQIGAWKALKEAGVKIKGVSGTSVGALNGALICMDDLERAENLWANISYSQIINVDDELMGRLFDKSQMKPEFLRETLKEIFRMLGEGGMDITPLRRLIEENIDEDLIRKSPVEFYSCTYSLTDRKELNVDMKTVPEGQMKDMLLASAYLPGFKNEKLHGKTYVDGGATNVLPMDVLLEHGYQDLILLRIFGVGREKKVSIPEGVSVTEIAPRGNLGNTLQFDAGKSRKNMRLGYYDALRAIYGLQGKIYYVEQTREECYYLKQLVQAKPEVRAALLEAYELDRSPEQEMRSFVELLLPLLAVELKLPKDWNYSSLYLAILETAARHCKVHRYRVYTVQQLLEETKRKIGENGIPEGMPDCVQLILDVKSGDEEEED